MLDRFDDRTLEIATVVVVVVIALIILCYLSIFINPQVPWNPFPPPTEVVEAPPTATTRPTWTPTPTDPPTATHTPTPTWTATATPTNTPTPTNTSTPTATATSTPAPTKKPPPPRPTATPTPWPYYYESAGARANCTRTTVYGWVLGSNGLPEADVQMRVGNDQGWRADTWTDANGRYQWDFAQAPQAGRWFVRVFKGGAARSMQFWWETSAGCEGPGALQEVEIIWRRR